MTVGNSGNLTHNSSLNKHFRLEKTVFPNGCNQQLTGFRFFPVLVGLGTFNRLHHFQSKTCRQIWKMILLNIHHGHKKMMRHQRQPRNAMAKNTSNLSCLVHLVLHLGLCFASSVGLFDPRSATCLSVCCHPVCLAFRLCPLTVR